MIVGGSPCQDFSVAGKQKGSVWKCKHCNHEYNPLTVHWSDRDKCPECDSKEIDKTRSSLLVEWLRVIRANKPNFGIYENVKNIVGKQFKETTFKIFEQELKEYGYNTYWKVLNAKNYGIPQNRERVYLILIKKELDNGKFKFPEPFDTGLRLKDILEDRVDEKYYLSDEKTYKMLKTSGEKLKEYMGNVTALVSNKGENFSRASNVQATSVARDYKGFGNQETNAVIKVGNVNPSNKGMNGNDFAEDGLSPTLTTNKGEGNKIAIKQATKQGYIECEIGGVADLSYPESKTRRERVQRGGQICPTLTATETGVCRIENIALCEQRADEGLRFFKDDVSGAMRTIDACGDKRVIESWEQNPPNERFFKQALETFNSIDVKYGDSIDAYNKRCNTSGYCPTITTRPEGFKTAILPVTKQLRIRKLTPKECFRLMGFPDNAFEAAYGAGVSNSQLYKQAGNSIVVDVLYYILRELYIAMPYLFDDLKLSSYFSGIGAFELALDHLFEDINSGNFTNPQAE